MISLPQGWPQATSPSVFLSPLPQQYTRGPAHSCSLTGVTARPTWATSGLCCCLFEELWKTLSERTKVREGPSPLLTLPEPPGSHDLTLPLLWLQQSWLPSSHFSHSAAELLP